MTRYKRNVESAKFLTVLIFLTFAISDFSDFYFLTKQFSAEKEIIVRDTSTEVRNTLTNYQIEALKKADEMKTETLLKLGNVYKDDQKTLESDMSKLVNSKSFTPFLQVLSETTGTKSFKNITGNAKDNNDGNALNKDGVLADNSKNCASDGPIKTWENEAKLHFNKILPFKVREDLFLNGKNTSFWVFIDVPKNLPFHNDLEQLDSTDISGLMELFVKYNDLRMFDYIEFINVSHVHRDRDIFGNFAILGNGYRQDNKIFAVNMPFVLGDVLRLPSEHSKLAKIESFQKQIRSLQLSYGEKKSPVVGKLITKLIVAFVLFFLMKNDIVKKEDEITEETAVEDNK